MGYVVGDRYQREPDGTSSGSGSESIVSSPTPMSQEQSACTSPIDLSRGLNALVENLPMADGKSASPSSVSTLQGSLDSHHSSRQ